MSALINVARNLGGSIGVSLANTELVQRSQFHQSRLVENLIPSSPGLQSTLHNITGYFAQSGSPASAPSRAMGYIAHLVSDQAALMAYIDIFYGWCIFAIVLVPLTGGFAEASTSAAPAHPRPHPAPGRYPC